MPFASAGHLGFSGLGAPPQFTGGRQGGVCVPLGLGRPREVGPFISASVVSEPCCRPRWKLLALLTHSWIGNQPEKRAQAAAV